MSTTPPTSPRLGGGRLLASASLGSAALAPSAAVGNLLQGYNTGVIAAALLSIVPEFGLAQRPGVVGLIASSTTLGAFSGTIASGPLCDRAGRRSTLMLSSVLFLLGGALMAWSPTVEVLLIGRLVSGVAAGLVSTAVPTYLAECAPAAWRGAMSTLPQLCVSSGILLSYLVGLAALLGSADWRFMLGVSMVPALVQAACVLRLPESPRWLLNKRGDADAARRALQRLRGSDDVETELTALSKGLEREAAAVAGSEAAGFGKLLAVPALRRTLLVCATLQMFQQMCGVNAIVYFTPQILREAGAPQLLAQVRPGWSADTAAMAATTLAYLPKIPSVLLTTYLIDRSGRRALLTTVVPVMAACLVALAACLGSGGTVPAAGAVATAAVMLYGVFFGMSLGPMPNIIASELFPTHARSAGVALSTSVQWIFNALVAAAFPLLVKQFGTSGVLYGFALVCVAAWLFVLRFVPETRGVPLEELGRLMERDGDGKKGKAE